MVTSYFGIRKVFAGLKNRQRGGNSVCGTKVDRIAVCQAFLDARGGGNYLEIGVSRGGSFMPVRAKAKWGVDPGYLITRNQYLKLRLRALLAGREVRLFKLTSDDFFQRRRGWLGCRGIDVALLDGLHTYQQTLRDVLNTLAFLKPGGAIVIHDCNPATALAATPALSYDDMMKRIPGFQGDWNGDVWKVIVHLRALRSDLEAVVLDCDYGVGVVRRQPAQERLRRSQEQIDALQYADLALNRQEFLGLTAPGDVWEIVAATRRLQGSQSDPTASARGLSEPPSACKNPVRPS
jgi:hypothetical protein